MSDLTLKAEQVQAISAIYGGSDVFFFLPTGFDKSICFHLLPFLFEHKLGSQKIKCCYLSTDLSNGRPSLLSAITSAARERVRHDLAGHPLLGHIGIFGHTFARP